GRRIVELHREIQGKNRLLEELALTDSLTGLPNRRAIEDWAVRQLNGAVRHGFPFWVVMADLDSFKNVNDTYGHQAGDTVLKRFAELLRANTRASNMCGRIGGEEFVAVVSHTEKTNIQIVVERIQLNGAVRHGFPFWVVMADLDSFKNVNDTYGHQAGDTVLKRFAELLRANTRASNMCGRIGGEEFVAVVSHTEKTNIQIVVERI